MKINPSTVVLAAIITVATLIVCCDSEANKDAASTNVTDSLSIDDSIPVAEEPANTDSINETPVPVPEPSSKELPVKPTGTKTTVVKTGTTQTDTKPDDIKVVEEIKVPDEIVTKNPDPIQEEIVKPVEEKPRQEAPAKWPVPAKDNAKVNPVTSNAESIKLGKSLYVKHCTSCHGKSGEGDGPKAAKLETTMESFRLPAFQNQTDGAIFYKTRTGRDDMPSFSKKIPDEEDIWHLVNYIRTLK